MKMTNLSVLFLLGLFSIIGVGGEKSPESVREKETKEVSLKAKAPLQMVSSHDAIPGQLASQNTLE